MDAVDFVKNFGRMCYEFEDCTLCPCHNTNFCIDSLSNLQSLESSIKAVQIVEKWSAEHPCRTDRADANCPDCLHDFWSEEVK